MRDGLRSRAYSSTKIHQGGVPLPINLPLIQHLDDTQPENFDSGTEQETLISNPKEGTDFHHEDGPNHKELSDDIGIGFGFTNCSRKRRRVDGRGEIGDAGVETTVLKEDSLDKKLQVFGRVLRSRSAKKPEGYGEGDREKNETSIVGRRIQESDHSGKRRVEVKKEELDYCEGENTDQSYSEATKKLKRKRGRPPKAQKNDGSQKERIEVKNAPTDKDSYNADNEVSQKIKRKRGRPPKLLKSDGLEKNKVRVDKEVTCQCAGEESNGSCDKVRKKLKSKRGRPPKNKNHKNENGKMVGEQRKNKRGMKSRQNLYYNEGNSQLSAKEVLRKEPNVKQLVSAKKIKCSDYEKGGTTKQNAGAMGKNRLERQVVKDKIVDLLVAAGWTIEYRPRNGREYYDAVYVNPEGRTHWSVTLAYRVLKNQYENGGVESMDCNISFKFTPVPEEELNILTKVISKERCDKNKKKKKWKEGESCENIVGRLAQKKKRKGKPHKNKLVIKGSLCHKILKKRGKFKALLDKHDDSAGTSDKGATTSARDCMRLKTHDRKRCALMVRNSKDRFESEGDSYMLYNGKRTVLAWMINMGTVPLNGKVQYLKCRKTQVHTGRITADGIQCDCCNTTLTVSEFEAHAGSKTHQPIENIYLENGHSLLQCQLESWHKQDESVLRGFHFVNVDGEDPNDDTCGICGDGGDLICCDGCPSTFHQGCLEIKKFPSGVWHCMHCSCKFCGNIGENTRQGDNDAAETPALHLCCLCEEKYHKSCVPVKDDINDDPSISSFCGKNCQELYNRLQKLLGVKHELEEGFSWTLIRRFDVGSDISLGGMPQKLECNSKVAVALDILDECFLPMADHRSGVNLIRNVVYNFGSNFNRLNYNGFITAILEKGDETIAAASIRIHGNYLAEMPFIGTRHMYRRQGMCRRLLGAIETALCSLHVEKLIIPAISEMRETWTSVFGFKHVEHLSKQMMRNMNLLVFPGVEMLQKPLLMPHFEEKNIISESLQSTKLKEHKITDDSINDSDERFPVGFDLKSEIETGILAGKTDFDLATVEFGSSLPDSCLNDTSDIKSEIVRCASEVNGEVAFIKSTSLAPNSCLNDASDITKEKVSLSLNLNEPAAADVSPLLHEGSVHATFDIVTSKPQEFGVEHDIKFAIGNISHDVVQSACMTTHRKVQDAVNGHFVILPDDHEMSSCEGGEMGVIIATGGDVDVNAKHNSKTCMSNGH